MLALRLPPEIEKRLTDLAHTTGRTKSYYAKLAIEEFLDNQEDQFIAAERLRHKLPAISLEEVIIKLGIKEDELEN
jgi:RHH-type transcriptional regulator, rel operon repressor / antitoxin RelB